MVAPEPKSSNEYRSVSAQNGSGEVSEFRLLRADNRSVDSSILSPATSFPNKFAKVVIGVAAAHPFD
jgi:hypothetical protein